MKTATLTLIGLGLCAQVQGESLSTTDGATFNHITTRRAEPDGLYIEYTPPGGGLGMAKIKFARLTPGQQKELGYNAEKARDYEAKVAKAAELWRQEAIRLEQIAKAEQQARETREDQAEQAVTDHIRALAQLEEAEADFARSQNDSGYGGSSWGGGVGAFGIPELDSRRHVPRSAINSFDPIPFVGQNPIPPNFGTIRAKKRFDK